MRPDRGVLDRPGPAPGASLRYGERPEQVVDLYLPDSAPHAWVALVHGGFWRERWDRTHLRPLAGALRAQGYGVALLEYARSGMPAGGWPGTFEDVAAGLLAVRRHLGAGVPLVLAGHSAGGHLALWLLHQDAAAAAPDLAPVAGAVSLAGCLDLGLVASLGLDEDAAGDLMGGSPAQVPQRYAVADPAALGRTPYPVVVVHGSADEKVPEQVAEAWWQAAGSPGRDRMVRLEGVSHFPLVDPLDPSYEVLLQQIEGLLGRA